MTKIHHILSILEAVAPPYLQESYDNAGLIVGDPNAEFAGKVYSDPRTSTNKTLKLHVFIDATSIELFADDGALCMTEIFFPSEDFGNIKLYAENGKLGLKKGEGFGLRSIWP